MRGDGGSRGGLKRITLIADHEHLDLFFSLRSAKNGFQAGEGPHALQLGLIWAEALGIQGRGHCTPTIGGKGLEPASAVEIVRWVTWRRI